jgi:hypothetical protein
MTQSSIGSSCPEAEVRLPLLERLQQSRARSQESRTAPISEICDETRSRPKVASAPSGWLPIDPVSRISLTVPPLAARRATPLDPQDAQIASKYAKVQYPYLRTQRPEAIDPSVVEHKEPMVTRRTKLMPRKFHLCPQW